MLILNRLDPSLNMARFCTLSLENSLFGDILLVRRRGRIGTHERVRFDQFDGLATAANELMRIATVKAGRRYRVWPKGPARWAPGPGFGPLRP
jgi:predicted DNA-binding WGR domain protein